MFRLPGHDGQGLDDGVLTLGRVLPRGRSKRSSYFID